MAALPQAIVMPTVAAIYHAYEQRANSWPRAHLGASVIGRECKRALWYGFRWAKRVRFEGRLLQLFDRGRREEAVFVAALRAAGIEVYEVDPETGGQFRFSDVGGHMGGSMDACASGFPEAPKTYHVCEFKTHNAKSFAALKAQGVERAKPEHATQMQCYMHWSGMTSAFYLAVNKDTDELYSERLHYDKARALAAIALATRIIQSPEPPTRLSERPDWYVCRFCDYREICHQGQIPEVSCRTCAHATPEPDGAARWSCARYRCDLLLEVQREGERCGAHVFIPALLPWKAVDANPEEGWIEYEIPGGANIRNGPGGWASRELTANAELAGDTIVERLRAEMRAEVLANVVANRRDGSEADGTSG
jgi:hypothetical protein